MFVPKDKVLGMIIVSAIVEYYKAYLEYENRPIYMEYVIKAKKTDLIGREVTIMKKSKLMRLISGIMLVVAVIFVFCALSNPALGSTIYIGTWAFGAEQWRLCYKISVGIMLVLSLGSFFKRRKAN